ncbi:MAG: hypothetical protein AB7O32_00585 [Vicinamibacterales bacterium]
MVLESNAQNALADAFDALVNTGAGTAQLKLETSGDVEVAAFDFQNPAFGSAVAGVITLQGTPIADGSAAGGTVEHGSIYNRNGDKVSESPAATSGQEITMSSLTIGAGETVTLTSLTVTQPAS